MSKWDKLLLIIHTLSGDLTIKKVYVELVRDIVEMEAGENENN